MTSGPRPPRVRRAAAVALAAALGGTGCGTSAAPATTGRPASATTAGIPSTTRAEPATTVVATTAAPPTTTGAATTATDPPAGRLVVDGPGRYEGEIVSGGLRRAFVLVVPASAACPAPLVLVFHGFTASPGEMEAKTGMSELAEEGGFLVAYPAGTGLPRRWLSDPAQGDQDVDFTRDLVALVSEVVPIDPKRVYAAGFSNGGGMAARLACDAADLVAAVGPVAATYPGGPCAPVRPVPVGAFHGTADPVVPYGGAGEVLPAVEAVMREWAGRNGCAPEPIAETVAAGVTRATWGGCAARADVVLYQVEGGRHGWPGSGDGSIWGRTTDAVSASALLWEFFAAHPMP